MIRYQPRLIFWLLVFLWSSCVTRAQAPANVPVFEITPTDSKIRFDVEASVSIHIQVHKDRSDR